jgi:hypothetical protein
MRDILAAKSGTMGEKGPVILPTWRLYSRHKGSFTCRKSTTWDWLFYFLSEGRRAEDILTLKNPTASAGLAEGNGNETLKLPNSRQFGKHDGV